MNNLGMFSTFQFRPLVITYPEETAHHVAAWFPRRRFVIFLRAGDITARPGNAAPSASQNRKRRAANSASRSASAGDARAIKSPTR